MQTPPHASLGPTGTHNRVGDSPISTPPARCRHHKLRTVRLPHRDPWGGASLSLESLAAAAIGAVAVVPLVALRAWTWSPAATRLLPALDEVHAGQLETTKPWLSGMTQEQVSGPEQGTALPCAWAYRLSMCIITAGPEPATTCVACHQTAWPPAVLGLKVCTFCGRCA